MSTIPTINSDHFYGQQNLNDGHRRASDAVLEEILAAAKVDVLALEADMATAQADITTAQADIVALEALDHIENEGSVAVVQLIQGGQPVANDTLSVGADVYEADGAGANINFAIGGSAEATLDNLLAAAQASGTENLKWDKLSATTLRIRSASTPDGTVVGADPSVVLDASSLTNYSFDVGDVSMNTLAGVAKGDIFSAHTKITVTTAMITATTLRIACPFTPRVFHVTLMTSAGALKMAATDTFAISGDDILVTLGGGGGDLANTDVIQISIYS